LYGITLPLREMAGDEENGTDNNDSLAVAAAVQPLIGEWTELPAPYAEDVQNEVVGVAVSSSAATPGQLLAAADNAEDLANQISQLCFSSPLCVRDPVTGVL
jgi:hypothetical protein